MSQTKKINQTDEVAKIGKPETDPTVEVLYQKLGDKWYAFSIINDEVFFGSVPSEMGAGPDTGADKKAS